jgi:GT2 family glycosyltransferase
MPWVRYIHLLNNDTEPEQDFIKHLYEVMEDDENLSMATSVRLHPKDGSYECELYGIDLLRGFQSVTKLEHLKDEVIQCNWAPLCSSLIRVSAVKYLGLLDKRMRNHSSDLDYCIRAKMNGFNHVIVTRSRVIHHHEITTRSVGASPENDQRVLLEKLAGLYYAQFMAKIPLDAENLTFGKLEFSVYKK